MLISTIMSKLRWNRALSSYDRGRATSQKDSVCNAPSNNLYFSVDGQVSPCWLYYPYPPPRWSPDRSIADIWNGEEFREVRLALSENRFIGRCSECKTDIATGNRPLAAAYDNEHPIGEWPTMLEMELSNLCNLECIMCTGQLSSKIRKNRDHLPPLVSPYDDSFVSQVEEIIPHLHEIRFNGGEPLLQSIVHKITERIAVIKPELKVTVATNGTVLNDKVRRMLEHCNVHLNISIDSLVAERYEEIRKNGDFETVMANFSDFNEYCKENDRDLCVMVNPMRMNWMEMADYLWWCHDNETRLWFNTIREPQHLALHSLGHSELTKIYDTMSNKSLPPAPVGPAGQARPDNGGVYRAWLHQLATWRDASEDRPPTQGVPVELRPTVARPSRDSSKR